MLSRNIYQNLAKPNLDVLTIQNLLRKNTLRAMLKTQHFSIFPRYMTHHLGAIQLETVLSKPRIHWGKCISQHALSCKSWEVEWRGPSTTWKQCLYENSLVGQRILLKKNICREVWKNSSVHGWNCHVALRQYRKLVNREWTIGRLILIPLSTTRIHQ